MPSVSTAVREITVAHSPDSDDAFMFYALATNKVRVPGLKFTHTLTDIETLNRKAMEGFYDVSAISFHAYPYVQDKYALMPCGGSVGEQYGPMVISTRVVGLEELKTMKIAVPGTMTTAYLALKLFAPKIETAVVPFDRIIQEVLAGKCPGHRQRLAVRGGAPVVGAERGHRGQHERRGGPDGPVGRARRDARHG